MNPTQTSTSLRTSGWLYLIFLVAVLASLTLVATYPSPAAAQSVRKQVLYINSYHPGYKFSDDITRALSDTFAEQGNIDLRIEYLDSKRIDSPEYLEQVRQLYQEKYKNAQIDLIMSSDDVALNFLFKNADSLFPDIPVVFVGANFFDTTRLADYERFTGISEEADITGTLDVALSLQTGINKVVVVNDTTVTGQNIRRIFDEVMSQYPQITFEFLEDVSMSEIQQQVSILSPDSLVLLTIFGRDKNGVFYEYDQFTPLIAKSSAVPVYGTWDFSLGYGIVGGKLTSGYTEGERGAKLAIRILNGENPADIPVEKQTQSQYLFDYKMLERWGIDSADLPEGSVVLGKPTSFYEENTTLAWGIAIGFALLLFAIVFLVINNNQRRIVQKRLAQSNQELQVLQVSLEQRVDERTKALTTVSEIGTAASTILEIDKLLQEVVNVSKERFGLYHAHIYLLDESEGNLVLASGAGEPGRHMVAQGRSIPLAQEKSLVARAARERQGVTVNDVTQEPDFLPNPLLPDTRSELAVPMMVGEKVIGVFDVQSDVVGRFTEADIAVQIALASQIASAVQNARLFEQTQTALLKSEEAQQLTSDVIDSTDDWIFIKDQDHRYRLVNQGYAKSLHIPKADFIGKNDLDLGFPEELVKGNPEKGINGFWADDRAVMNSGAPKNIPDDIVTIDGEIRVFDTVKIPLRNADNNVWGVLAFSRDMTERRNLEALTRRRAEQEEALSRITQKIQGTNTMSEALQVVARELGHALGNKSTLVMLEPDAMSDKSLTFHGEADSVPNPETT